MKTKITNLLMTFALIAVLFNNVSATTWFPQDFTCPIDSTKNNFLVVGSYGSYVYSYPSKYQWLFFPITENNAFYICKKCHLSTYMWDFDDLPKDKLPAVKKVLADIKVSKTFDDYNQIAVTERLEIMQKVYGVLDKDDEWWERFHRVKGYHYDKSGDAKKPPKNDANR